MSREPRSAGAVRVLSWLALLITVAFLVLFAVGAIDALAAHH
ncbi:MAG TPA: hypothetical protein VF533_13750 [Solirubrobacteraceae bacterium]|jgi:hypothetical protein